MADLAVRRVDFGYFVRPAEETGTGTPRVEPCLGYLVSHPAGLLLVDTGMGSHPDVDAHYRPRRRDGTVVVAGQSHDTASAYGADTLAWQARRDQHSQTLPVTPAWIDRIQQLDPARVVFAHDNAVWEPGRCNPARVNDGPAFRR